MDAFKATAGYNVLIQILSKFLTIGLPPMEIAIKGVLLANMKNLLSCSINPFISEEILRDGIVFNLEQIDMTDTLKYCPTSKDGQYYYFDIVSKIPKLGVEGAIDAAIIGVEYSIPSSSKRGEVMQRKGQRLPIKFVIDESKIQVNHAFINVYSEAEIKRLESIMIDNKKKNEKDAVIYAYNQIINICQEIGNAKLARDYKDSLEEYKRSNIIVTKATSESSKSSINDNLPIL